MITGSAAELTVSVSPVQAALASVLIEPVALASVTTRLVPSPVNCKRSLPKTPLAGKLPIVAVSVPFACSVW